MTHSTLSRGVLALCIIFLVLPIGCGKDKEAPTAPDWFDDSAVVIETYGTPSVTFDDEDITTLVVQFIVRDGNRQPLADEDLEIELQIDGESLDIEGPLEEDSEALSSSLHLTLVLDASYSMTRHDPPAFAPMLTAARQATSAGKQLYVDRPGTFDWDLVWFNDVIYRPDETLPNTFWLETDIERIPEPDSGAFTKLYAAVKSAVESSAAHRATTNATARDQHLVVVFSDGADNYSFSNNADESGTGSIGNDRTYEWTGSTPVSLNDVKAQLAANPGVQVQVMGLGSAVDDAALATIASEGRGRYVKNVDPANVDVLFDEITREFTSLQTRGAMLPLEPGDYTFSIVVRRTDTGAATRSSFRFRTGDDARVID